jgi:hypothetical protein
VNVANGGQSMAAAQQRKGEYGVQQPMVLMEQ